MKWNCEAFLSYFSLLFGKPDNLATSLQCEGDGGFILSMPGRGSKSVHCCARKFQGNEWQINIKFWLFSQATKAQKVTFSAIVYPVIFQMIISLSDYLSNDNIVTLFHS